MFDWIKRFLGLSTCFGCRWRRCFGLWCGCRTKSALPHRAWSRDYGCWHYANPPGAPWLCKENP